ncbi:MAG: hypothetical protein ABH854_05155 [Candidatus Diapherotrites archaeon]|nr:hypothetical protein [Candidatus Micrarchaeota archaeon]MBU1939550.1 hypothetical protein [Candidatus Micrarchaeota archaeon]
MGVIKLMATVAGLFLLLELLAAGGMHIFVQSSFITVGGMVALFCFLIIEITFVTFK